LWSEGAQVIEGVVDHGFHLYALLPPHQGKLPVLCLRRIKTDARSLSALVAEDVLSEDMREFLALMLRSGRRVLVAASGGINVNRFMQAIIGEIPARLRVATISDRGLVGARHHGWLTIRRMNDPADAMSLSDVVGLLLRGGLDLLVSHQVSALDATEVLDAFSGASRGALASLWAISPAHALSRLAAFGAQTGASVTPLTTALAHAVDVIVQVSSGINGESMQIRELIAPRVDVDGAIDLQALFQATRAEGDRRTVFSPSIILPQVMQDLRDQGIEVPARLMRL
jgi:Flp pilus assembly CpaF family ATPase